MWKQLNWDDLKTILSQDELERLTTVSVDEDIENIVNNCCNLISEMWRGALAAKGYTIDTRDYYTPSEYTYWILVHIRWAVWTRFPQSSDIALDKAREAEYKQALELMKSPSIDVGKPDSEHGGGDGDSKKIGGASIFLPPMRFTPWYYGGVKEDGSILWI